MRCGRVPSNPARLDMRVAKLASARARWPIPYLAPNAVSRDWHAFRSRATTCSPSRRSALEPLWV